LCCYVSQSRSGRGTLTTFWAIINTTNYTTTNGTINTGLSLNFTYDGNVTAQNFNRSSNSTITSDWLATIEQEEIDHELNYSTDELLTNEPINLTCSITQGANITQSDWIEFHHVITNVNESVTYNFTNNVTTLAYNDTYIFTPNITYWQDQVNFTCNILNQHGYWGGTTTSNSTEIITHSIIDSIFNFTFLSGGSWVDSISFTTNMTAGAHTSNPQTFYATTFINKSQTTQNLSVNATDTNGFNYDLISSKILNENTTYYEFNMTPAELLLYFYQNGTAYNSSGRIQDNDSTEYFQNTSLLIQQSSLSTIHRIVTGKHFFRRFKS